MALKEKTDTDRIKEIYKLCKGDFGDAFENLTADGKTSTDAIKNLRSRVKKIIKRYNEA